MENQVSKQQVHDVLSGKIKVRFGDSLQAITRYLEASKEASSFPKKSKHFKNQEAKGLEDFAKQNSLWIEEIDFSNYISEGAEQRVYLEKPQFVIKLNDSIYYESWLDYFYNLILHNFFFDDTAYELIGLTHHYDRIFAVVRQNYVISTSSTNLIEVRYFLEYNGFQNIRNNDYFNPELQLILEDLHDENVLTQNNMLFFIDTVFFLTPQFWDTKDVATNYDNSRFTPDKG